MSQVNQITTQTPASSIKMLRAMVGIGVICALLIVLTYETTLPRIERNKAEALENAIFKVIPGITKIKPFQLDQNNQFSIVPGTVKPTSVIYAGYDEKGNFAGVAIEASGQGYADILRILYGYVPDEEKIVGFYVLESKETPGLGDKIEKDANFLANFKGLDVALTNQKDKLKNPIVQVKHGTKKNAWEIDGITGATISSRAIGQMMNTSTKQWIPIIYNQQQEFASKSHTNETSQE
jgi:electron transport complex protein RnfG